MITKDHWDEIQALTSAQEEVNTRMLLHAQHASEDGHRAIVITAKDADVLIRCLCFSKKMACHMYQKCGTQSRTRYIDTKKLAGTLGKDGCQGHVGLHSLTGGDTVSAFSTCGKLSALTHLKKSVT